MTPIDPTRAARVRKLATKATSGPWRSSYCDWPIVVRAGCLCGAPTCGIIASVNGEGGDEQSAADADFIAECDPAFILSLLDAASRGGGEDTRDAARWRFVKPYLRIESDVESCDFPSKYWNALSVTDEMIPLPDGFVSLDINGHVDRAIAATSSSATSADQ